MGICGQAPSDHADFAEFLVECGIDSMSLNPDSVVRVKRRVAQAESRLAERPRGVLSDLAIGYEDVLAASRRIRSHVHRTPVMTSRLIDEAAGMRLFFKCENLSAQGLSKRAAPSISCSP